jgi:hypothetical protein
MDNSLSLRVQVFLYSEAMADQMITRRNRPNYLILENGIDAFCSQNDEDTLSGDEYQLPESMVTAVSQADLDSCMMGMPATVRFMTGGPTAPRDSRLMGLHGRIMPHASDGFWYGLGAV